MYLKMNFKDSKMELIKLRKLQREAVLKNNKELYFEISYNKDKVARHMRYMIWKSKRQINKYNKSNTNNTSKEF